MITSLIIGIGAYFLIGAIVFRCLFGWPNFWTLSLWPIAIALSVHDVISAKRNYAKKFFEEWYPNYWWLKNIKTRRINDN